MVDSIRLLGRRLVELMRVCASMFSWAEWGHGRGVHCTRRWHSCASWCPFLRLVNIPFEHEVRFRRWLGHFSLLIMLLHTVTFFLHIYYTNDIHIHNVFQWKYYGVSNLAGVICMIVGLVVWVTSLGLIRVRFFDFFYIAHHLYIVVLAFAMWHVGDYSSWYFLAGVLVFFTDRFIRMVQSQHPVAIFGARVLPSGVVELKFPKSQKLRYSALGFIFINVPAISRFQWHPFSTTSSSFQSSDEITVIIKPLSTWSRDLQNLIIDRSSTNANPKSAEARCPLSLQLFAEGSYCPGKGYFLCYKTLILVAGGVGITPFIDVLRDLLCRHNQGKGQDHHIPNEVHLIWCVPKQADLATLREVQPALGFPNYAGGGLRGHVKAFVMRESTGAGGDAKGVLGYSEYSGQE